MYLYFPLSTSRSIWNESKILGKILLKAFRRWLLTYFVFVDNENNESTQNVMTQVYLILTNLRETCRS